LGTGLLIAGHETTANMIGLGVLALLQIPSRQRSSAMPKTPRSRPTRSRVASLPEHHPERPAPRRRRRHPHRREVIRAGEGIIIDLAPANWDAQAFAEPDRLYLHRSGADRNVAFGYGRHQCVGQQLARAEMQIVFGTLFRRVPTLELAIPFEDSRSRMTARLRLYELPVSGRRR